MKEIQQFLSNDNFSYVLTCPLTRECVVIDPSENVDHILKACGNKLTTVLFTHGHPDHVMGIEKLIKFTPNPIEVWAHKLEMDYILPWVKNIHILRDGDILPIGSLKIHVHHTPGHTPGSLCFSYKNALFTGDTLFIDYIGRTDLPGGSSEEMYETLYDRFNKFHANTIIYPGHHYGNNPTMITSTLERERKENKFLMAANFEEFKNLL